MKRILIISPHYPPSNLAAVHRTRLFAQHLPSFGWEPIILSVHEDFYEEELDWELHSLLPKDQRIEKVAAYAISRPRFIGDIGLRAFFQLRKRALELIQSEKIDFVYIPIPSFYTALIGPYLFKKTGVPYGIDYIDPWVHHFPGSDKLFSRHWFSTQLAKVLEPIAVKHASLITGVSEGYYAPVLERNPHLKKQAITAAMPYGGEERDHEYVRGDVSRESRDVGPEGVQHESFNPSTSSTSSTLQLSSTPSTLQLPQPPSTFNLVYAGALLPKAIKPLEQIFIALSNLYNTSTPSTSHVSPLGPNVSRLTSHVSRLTSNISRLSTNISRLTSNVSFHFIGTAKKVQPLAEKYGLCNSIVFEHPNRIPYLDVLKKLEAADGIFILGSTEPHYTPSKVYQAVLSKKPILAVLHEKSTAVNIIKDSKAGVVVTMNGEEELDSLPIHFLEVLKQFQDFQHSFNSSKIDKAAFEQYSAKSVTGQLVEKLDEIVSSSASLG